MARISRGELTRLQIIKVACDLFLEKGYTNTSASMICKELGISPGNLTFYFPTKEHLLEVLVDLLGRYQWKLMEEEADDGINSIMAICLELMAMTVICREDEVLRDFYFSTYTSKLSLAVIRRNDTKRAREVFGQFRPDWDDEHFAEAELLVSGIEYATLTEDSEVSPELRVSSALRVILGIYGVPQEVQERKIARVLAMDHRAVARRIHNDFKAYVAEVNEQALLDLLRV